MSKIEFDKEDWLEFRNEIIELVILYHQVKEYLEFDKDNIEYIKSFFHLSKKQAITAFFIKVGFLVTDGSPTLKNFLGKEDYDELMKIYISKVGLVRDKLYAHNAKTDRKMKNFTLSNEDVEVLYAKIILLAKEIDEKYNDSCNYEMVSNAGGIKSIEHFIERSIELKELKQSIIEQGYKASVELSISTGKIKIVEQD